MTHLLLLLFFVFAMLLSSSAQYKSDGGSANLYHHYNYYCHRDFIADVVQQPPHASLLNQNVDINEIECYYVVYITDSNGDSQVIGAPRRVARFNILENLMAFSEYRVQFVGCYGGWSINPIEIVFHTFGRPRSDRYKPPQREDVIIYRNDDDARLSIVVSSAGINDVCPSLNQSFMYCHPHTTDFECRSRPSPAFHRFWIAAECTALFILFMGVQIIVLRVCP
jgi:hypothetical protein